MAFISSPTGRPTAALAPVVFTLTIFLSASLLFFVQPLFTKVVLPHIGGAPAVWTTAMLFFQSVLIAGYLYAHILSRKFSVRAQMLIHLSLWAAALFFLPLAVPQGWRFDGSGSAAVQTLLIYAAGVGLPFAVLSANAPLIQAWYARSGGPSSDDPYFLYGASNLGSLIALLGFPLIAEPLLGATAIGKGWSLGFIALGLCLFASSLFSGAAAAAPAQATASTTSPAWSTRVKWAAIAFVPSSLMLALTSKISTDIGSIPLVWVIPLSLYLLTFVLVFTNRPLIGPKSLRLAYLLGLGVLAAVFSNIFGVHVSLIAAGLSVLAFFAVSLFAHDLLYRLRPAAEHLTIFYVTMSIGGALGGLFNSIFAPLFFNDLYEGAVTVVIAGCLAIGGTGKLSPRDFYVATFGGLIVLLALLAEERAEGIVGHNAYSMFKLALVIAVIFFAGRKGKVLAAATLTVVVIGFAAVHSSTLLSDRSFFGTHKVFDKDELRLYANGTTLHGSQTISEISSKNPKPLSYYHPNGPMAQILTSEFGKSARSIGIVGLGVGALACYAQPGQDWHFYEIDRLVDDIARNPALFGYMSACAGRAPTHLGDARMVLAEQDGLTFDVLVIDAYSSDSVPVHLTTKEAIEIYLERLSPDGLLLFHISNRYYDIDRPLGRAAEALGLTALWQRYAGNLKRDPGDSPSVVALMTRSDVLSRTVAEDPRWQLLESDGGRVWTDDFANVLSILRR